MEGHLATWQGNEHENIEVNNTSTENLYMNEKAENCKPVNILKEVEGADRDIPDDQLHDQPSLPHIISLGII